MAYAEWLFKRALAAEPGHPTVLVRYAGAHLTKWSICGCAFDQMVKWPGHPTVLGGVRYAGAHLTKWSKK